MIPVYTHYYYSKAYAAAIYTALGTSQEGLNYWKKIPEPEKAIYLSGFGQGLNSGKVQNSDGIFIENTLHWGPTAVEGFKTFVATYKDQL